MSAAALELLVAFGLLPGAEQDAVLGELLLRRPVGAGDLPGEALVELAEELFLTYDAAEAAGAAPAR